MSDDLLKLWDRWRAEKIATGRLRELQQEAFGLIKEVAHEPIFECEFPHELPQAPPPPEFQAMRERNIVRFRSLRQQIDESPQFDDRMKLRLHIRGWKGITRGDREHAKEILQQIAFNLEAELRDIEQARNFRIAISTALLAIIATVLAFLSAFADIWSAFMK